MRKLLALLLVVAILCSANAEWSERLRVQTVDKNMKPLSGLSVEVNYQKQATDSIDGTETGKTNADGIFEVVLRNYVSAYAGKENRFYTITVTNPYKLPTYTRKVAYGDNPIGGAHLELFEYNTTAVKLTVAVKDQKHRPVANAKVSVGSVSEITNEKGIAVIGLPRGKYDMTVSKEGFSAKEKLTLSSDTEIPVELLIYENRLNVIATNEYGMPLPAVNVSFNDIKLQTNSSGEAEFKNLRVSKGTLIGIYNGIERKASIDFFEENVTKTLVFPSSPLIIDKLSIQTFNPYEKNCTVVIGCRARDERVALSKISLTLLYSKNGGAEWNSVTEKNELGIFEFSIPCAAPFELSYTLSASNEYGSVQTPTYNMTIPAPVECEKNATRACKTNRNCTGEQACVSGKWGKCIEVENGCPKNGGGNGGGGGGLFDIKLPEGMGIALVALMLVIVVGLIGGLGLLAVTQRDKLSGLFEGIKNWLASVRHVDRVIENADKEFARDKISQRFMKEGSTDEFFGLDKEDKLKPQKPPEKPPEQPKTPPEQPQTPPEEKPGS